MPSATAIPIVSEIIWTTVLLSVVFPLLLISASTPAMAMYINPPAVNPCKIRDSQCRILLTTQPTDTSWSIPHLNQGWLSRIFPPEQSLYQKDEIYKSFYVWTY